MLIAVSVLSELYGVVNRKMPRCRLWVITASRTFFALGLHSDGLRSVF